MDNISPGKITLVERLEAHEAPLKYILNVIGRFLTPVKENENKINPNCKAFRNNKKGIQASDLKAIVYYDKSHNPVSADLFSEGQDQGIFVTTEDGNQVKTYHVSTLSENSVVLRHKLFIPIL